MLRKVAIALVIAAVSGSAANAQVISSKNRAKLFSSQTKVLDTRAASQYRDSMRLQPPTVITPSKWNLPQYNGKYRGQYLNYRNINTDLQHKAIAHPADGGVEQ